jgi:hypothetical protein
MCGVCMHGSTARPFACVRVCGVVDWLPALVHVWRENNTPGGPGVLCTMCLAKRCKVLIMCPACAGFAVCLVALVRAGGLVSAVGGSPPCTSSLTLGAGSWGDAPLATAQAQTSSSASVTLAPPPLVSNPAQPSLYLLQWAVEEPGAGPTSPPPLPADMPSAAAALGAWASSHAASAAPALREDGAGEAGTSYLLHGSPALGGTVVVVMHPLPDAVRPVAPVVMVVIAGLTPGALYRMRARCDNVGGGLGPWTPTSPPTLVPQPPRVTGVSVVGGVLPTVGGTPVDVTGLQLGVGDAAVYMTLHNGVLGPFVSPRCVVVVPGLRVRCGAPPGVGAGHNVTLQVDGVNSTAGSPDGVQVLALLLSYAAPQVHAVDQVRHCGALPLRGAAKTHSLKPHPRAHHSAPLRALLHTH